MVLFVVLPLNICIFSRLYVQSVTHLKEAVTIEMFFLQASKLICMVMPFVYCQLIACSFVDNIIM